MHYSISRTALGYDATKFHDVRFLVNKSTFPDNKKIMIIIADIYIALLSETILSTFYLLAH